MEKEHDWNDTVDFLADYIAMFEKAYDAGKLELATETDSEDQYRHFSYWEGNVWDALDSEAKATLNDEELQDWDEYTSSRADDMAREEFDREFR